MNMGEFRAYLPPCQECKYMMLLQEDARTSYHDDAFCIHPSYDKPVFLCYVNPIGPIVRDPIDGSDHMSFIMLFWGYKPLCPLHLWDTYTNP